MAGGLSSLVALVLSSSVMLVGGQTSCSLSVTRFHFHTVTVLSAESVGGSTPGVRVTWNTTVPPECVASVRVEFRTSSGGPVVAIYTTTNTSQTEVIQTGLQCATNYSIRVVVTGELRLRVGELSPLHSDVQVLVEDIPFPFGVRAEVTADNTSIRVSWKWSCQGVLDLVRVHYRPEGASLMMYTVDNTTATSATLPNLQCNTKYTIWVYTSGSRTGRRSPSRTVSLPARAPPTPTEVTTEVTAASSVRVAWQWTSSGPAPDCFNTTIVTYHPEGGSESSLQLSDPAATEATLTDLQCNTNYTITVVATAGEHRREGVAFLPLQGLQNLSAAVLSPTSVYLTWMALCHTRQYHIYYNKTCGSYVDESRLDTDRQEHRFDGLQEDVNYSFTVTQTGFSGGRVLSTGPVYARTFTAVPSEAPQLLQAMFVQPTEVSLRWREVPCIQQNGPITGYDVRYYTTCSTDRDVRQKSVVTTGGIIDGLTSNTEYAFQVAAVNVNGTGPFSERITLGGAPQLVMVTPVNSTTVNVSWSEVQCFNGSGAVTHYLVQYWSMCSGAVRSVTTSSTIQTFSGLTPNYVYTFRVAAVGASQKIGPFSNPANTVPPDEPGSSCDSKPQSSSIPSLAAMVGVAVTAVLVLLVVAVVQSAVIWHQRRSTAGIKSQTQRTTAVTTEIPLKECSAYGQIGQGGGEREENYIYEHPQ